MIKLIPVTNSDAMVVVQDNQAIGVARRNVSHGGTSFWTLTFDRKFSDAELNQITHEIKPIIDDFETRATNQT
jgi:hypothetical protein